MRLPPIINGNQHVREMKIHWHWFLHDCQGGGKWLKKGLILPFSVLVIRLSECVCGHMRTFKLSIVRTIESVCGICCDATLTFAGLPGKVCKHLGATVVRMHTNYKASAATPLFADWPLVNRDSARGKLNRRIAKFNVGTPRSVWPFQSELKIGSVPYRNASGHVMGGGKWING